MTHTHKIQATVAALLLAVSTALGIVLAGPVNPSRAAAGGSTTPEVAIMDANIKVQSPNANYGTKNPLDLQAASWAGLFKFNVTNNAVPAGNTATLGHVEVTVQPTGSTINTGDMLQLFRTGSCFQESSVTWNTAPSKGTLIAEAALKPGGVPNATPDFVVPLDAINLSGNSCFWLSASSVNNTRLSKVFSREDKTVNYRPRMWLDYAPTATTTTTSSTTSTTIVPTTALPSTTTTLPSTTTTTIAPTTTLPPPPGGKAYRKGFVATDSDAGIDHPAIDTVIMHTNWSDLETADQVWNETEWSRLQAMINDHSTWQFALRMYAGDNAPRWLDNVSGPCVEVLNPKSGISGCVPRFWTAAFRMQYAQIMAEIARRFGPNPQFTDVIASACTTIFAENGIIGGDDPSAQRLNAAGLNQQNFVDCEMNTVADQVTALWSSGTRTSFVSHTGWQVATSAGVDSHPFSDWRDQVLIPLETAYGDKIVFQNNSLSGDNDCSNLGQPLSSANDLYCWLATRSFKNAPTPDEAVGFQFGSTTTHALMLQAAQNGVHIGGCYIERAVNNLESTLTAAEIADYDAQLGANCP